MAIRVQCPNCQKSYAVKDELAGKTLKCAACGASFPAPAAGPCDFDTTMNLLDAAVGLPRASGSTVLGTSGSAVLGTVSGNSSISLGTIPSGIMPSAAAPSGIASNEALPAVAMASAATPNETPPTNGSPPKVEGAVGRPPPKEVIAGAVKRAPPPPPPLLKPRIDVTVPTPSSAPPSASSASVVPSGGHGNHHPNGSGPGPRFSPPSAPAAPLFPPILDTPFPTIPAPSAGEPYLRPSWKPLGSDIESTLGHPPIKLRRRKTNLKPALVTLMTFGVIVVLLSAAAISGVALWRNVRGPTSSMAQRTPAQLLPDMYRNPAAFPQPARTQSLDGIQFSEVMLNGSRVWVFLPPNSTAPNSLPCVFVAPAGSNALLGMELGKGDLLEQLPYVMSGFAVVAYELPGNLKDWDNPTDKDIALATRACQASEGGMVNAVTALEYTLARVPQVDPNRLYVAGHSSAGTKAMQFAEHDSRIRACISYAGVYDTEVREAKLAGIVDWAVWGTKDFLHRTSPKTNIDKLKCPVFLFHAMDDPTVPATESAACAARLHELGNNMVTLVNATSGGHYDSMIEEGLPQGIHWLQQIAGLPATDLPSLRAKVPQTPVFPSFAPQTAGPTPPSASGITPNPGSTPAPYGSGAPAPYSGGTAGNGYRPNSNYPVGPTPNPYSSGSSPYQGPFPNTQPPSGTGPSGLPYGPYGGPSNSPFEQPSADNDPYNVPPTYTPPRYRPPRRYSRYKF